MPFTRPALFQAAISCWIASRTAAAAGLLWCPKIPAFLSFHSCHQVHIVRQLVIILVSIGALSHHTNPPVFQAWLVGFRLSDVPVKTLSNEKPSLPTEWALGEEVQRRFRVQIAELWHTHWYQGMPIKELLPNLFKHSSGFKLTLQQAVLNNKWIACIKRNPSLQVLREYLQLWSITQDLQLDPTSADDIKWKWTTNGQYSATSAYKMLFQGLIHSNYRELIWASRTPLKCQFHVWLAI